ncbi:MAG: GPW/gp25 family protein [Mariniphaga sp.]|nr:GPW/gp25 family protein [Mariniphaga sp.]
MLNNYIKVPLKTSLFDTDTFTSKKNVSGQKHNDFLFENQKVLIDAIKENLDLLLLSQEGELSFDKFFGLEIWNHNFESKKLKHDEKKLIEQEIIMDMNEYENRLKKNSHKVEILFKDEIKLIDGKKAKIHILEIKINSVLNEDFKSKETDFAHKLSVPVKVYYKT